MIILSLKVVTIFLLLAQGSSFTTPRNTKRLRHYNSDLINSKSLFHTDSRKLQTCPDGFTFNAWRAVAGSSLPIRTLSMLSNSRKILIMLSLIFLNRNS
jgi:hypothetical protein